MLFSLAIIFILFNFVRLKFVIMESARTKTAKVSAFATAPLIDDDDELFNDDTELSDADEWVTDADGNVFDKNGKLIGYTWEEVRYELTRKLSEAYGVDFFKVDRMREGGLLKDKDVTNELLLSPEFKYEPYPGFKPKPWPKPDNEEEVDEELEREIKQAMKEAVAEMVVEDDWEDDTL
jgi:hypothetical protein